MHRPKEYLIGQGISGMQITVFSEFNSNSNKKCVKVHFFPGWRGTPGAMMPVQMRMTTNVAPCLSDQRSLLLNSLFIGRVLGFQRWPLSF